MKAVDSSLVFFRVFDLAYFVPGILFALTITYTFDLSSEMAKVKVSTLAGILAVLGAIVGIYIVGLIIFSLAWWVHKKLLIVRKPPEEFAKENTPWPAFPLLFRHSTYEELVLYFWYLRATNLSLVVALPLCSLLVAGKALYLSLQVGAEAAEGGSTANTWAEPALFAMVLALGTIVFVLRSRNLSSTLDRSLAHRAMDEESWQDACKKAAQGRAKETAGDAGDSARNDQAGAT